MKILNTASLAATVDAANEAFFLGRTIPKPEKTATALWIASRQGMPGSYAGMFAPTKRDFERGLTFFTGEKMNTGAGTSHILGEEASRILILLDAGGAAVKQSLAKASERMIQLISHGVNKATGTYCCGKCSVAYWRNLAVGGFTNGESHLARGMKTLKARRDGKGRWGIFPFYYTLLALSEINLPAAVAEMKYAAPLCEQLLKRKPAGNVFDKRRRLLAEKILAVC